MIKPVITLHGTSAESLADGYVEVASNLRASLASLDEHGPNARDYLDDHTFRLAVAEHRTRINCIRGVLADIECLYAHASEHAP